MLYWLDQSEQIKLTFNSKDYSLIKNMITLANTVTSVLLGDYHQQDRPNCWDHRRRLQFSPVAGE